MSVHDGAAKVAASGVCVRVLQAARLRACARACEGGAVHLRNGRGRGESIVVTADRLLQALRTFHPLEHLRLQCAARALAVGAERAPPDEGGIPSPAAHANATISAPNTFPSSALAHACQPALEMSVETAHSPSLCYLCCATEGTGRPLPRTAAQQHCSSDIHYDCALHCSQRKGLTVYSFLQSRPRLPQSAHRVSSAHYRR